MVLNPDLLETFRQWQIIHMLKCRLCGGGSWSRPDLVALPLMVDGKPTLAGSVASIAVACMACAHLELFSYEAMVALQ